MPFGFRRGAAGELVPHEAEQEAGFAINEVACGDAYVKAYGEASKSIIDTATAASKAVGQVETLGDVSKKSSDDGEGALKSVLNSKLQLEQLLNSDTNAIASALVARPDFKTALANVSQDELKKLSSQIDSLQENILTMQNVSSNTIVNGTDPSVAGQKGSIDGLAGTYSWIMISLLPALRLVPPIPPRTWSALLAAQSRRSLRATRRYVEERLAGFVVAPSGAPVPGPVVSWKSRRHGPRKDRRWANAWSPEQIARRLPVDFADDATMRISHEAIYQALFVQGRGALRRELTACLRTGRVLRMPRARTRGRGKTFISPEIMISQRPAEAADRAVPGHWEGDLILGLGSSAIGTLVERTTRFSLLLYLPRMVAHGNEARVKKGPALAGHGAEAARDAISRTIVTLPEQLRRSLTWDQGAEMAQHARLKIEAGVRVYFCDPHSPGNAAPTRTLMDCCASTSPKAPISACTTPTRLPPWRPP